MAKVVRKEMESFSLLLLLLVRGKIFDVWFIFNYRNAATVGNTRFVPRSRVQLRGGKRVNEGQRRLLSSEKRSANECRRRTKWRWRGTEDKTPSRSLFSSRHWAATQPIFREIRFMIQYFEIFPLRWSNPEVDFQGNVKWERDRMRPWRKGRRRMEGTFNS